MKNQNYCFHHFSDKTLQVDVLASAVEEKLTAAVQKNGCASIAFSGGSTPKPLLIELSKRQIDWSNIIISLVDERWVEEQSDLSNTRFLKQYFIEPLQHKMHFLPLYHAGIPIQECAPSILADYYALTGKDNNTLPNFDVVILGIGEDGHTASYFPDAENIADLVEEESQDALAFCHSIASQVPRVTWSLPVLLRSEDLILHFCGKAKKSVFMQAAQTGSATQLPIRALMNRPHKPLEVYYAD